MFLAMELGIDVAAADYGPAAARSVIYFYYNINSIVDVQNRARHERIG